MVLYGGCVEASGERYGKLDEAWAQRATLNFLRGDYAQSLSDVATTLELEPRHFGALAGRALIRMRQGRTALAIQNIRQAMEYHPYLKERALVPPQYQDQDTGSR